MTHRIREMFKRYRRTGVNFLEDGESPTPVKDFMFGDASLVATIGEEAAQMSVISIYEETEKIDIPENQVKNVFDLEAGLDTSIISGGGDRAGVFLELDDVRNVVRSHKPNPEDAVEGPWRKKYEVFVDPETSRVLRKLQNFMHTVYPPEPAAAGLRTVS